MDTYIDDNLNKFMPATSLEVMKQFENDIENLIFIDLFLILILHLYT
jgi:hypothetical protein